MTKLRPNIVPYRIPLPNNMGMVRYVLALAVVLAHFKTLAGYDFYVPVSSYSGVGGFFALSGFLIYGSYLRKPGLKEYLKSRAIRILPAYWITVCFFAIVLAFVSTLHISDYLGSAGFWKYLVSNLAFLNFLQPSLPGVFGDMSVDAVNGSLWTMKVEWCLYITPPIVAWLVAKLRAKPTAMFVTIYVLACGYRLLFLYLADTTGTEAYYILSRQFFGQLSYFYAGVMCYYWYNVLMRYKWPLIIVAVTILLLCDYIPGGRIVLHPAAMAISVVWFSMVGKWGTWEGKRDNISYNIYLIHFPVIQLFVYLRGGNPIGLVPALLLCIGITMALSLLLNMTEIRIRRKIIRNKGKCSGG